MADDKRKNENNEDSEDSEDNEGSGKSELGLKKIIIISSVVFVFIIGGVVGLLMFLLSPEKSTDTSNENIDAVESSEEINPKLKQSYFYTIRPPFTVNFVASRKAKFLRVSVDLVMKDTDAIDYIEENLPFIKNDLVVLFSSRSFDELKTPEGKEQLRSESLGKVKTILKRETGKSWVNNILFTSFVMD